MHTAIKHSISILWLALTLVVTWDAFSQTGIAQEDANVMQFALTQAQIDRFIVAQKHMNRILAKAHSADQPNPKTMRRLDEVARKYKFADYAEFDDVGENIALVMRGIDPDTKKYVGPEALIEKEIVSIDSENLSPSGKKEQMDELKSELKSPGVPIEVSSNIDLVVKNYDRLNALMSSAP